MPTVNSTVGSPLYSAEFNSAKFLDPNGNQVSIAPDAKMNKYTIAAVHTVTGNTYAFVSGTPATITDSANGFINDNFRANEVITISGSGSNNKTVTIAAVAAGTLTLLGTDTLTNESVGASVTFKGDVTQITANSSSGVSGDASAANQTNRNQKTQLTNGSIDVGVVVSSLNSLSVASDGVTDQITLTTGSPISAVYDMINYPSYSISIISNSAPRTFIFQTSGNLAFTNPRGTAMYDSQTSINPLATISSASTNATFNGQSTGRYLRFQGLGLTGGDTIVFSLTRYTQYRGTNSIATGSTRDAGGSVPASPTYIAGQARTSLLTNNNSWIAGLTTDLNNRLVVTNETIRELKSDSTVTLSNTTAETTMVAAIASVKNDLTGLVISNSSASSTFIEIRDTTGGTVRAKIFVPANSCISIPINNANVKQSAANTNWTAKCLTAVTEINIFVTYVRNI